jgi:hypothetical protein
MLSVSNNNKILCESARQVHLLYPWHVVADSPKSTLQNNVAKAEREVDAADALTSKRKNIETEIEEKERRIQLVKDEIKAANFEERLGEKAVKARGMEAKVIELNGEIQSLNTQGSTRTRLDISRGNLTKTENEIKNRYVSHASCFFRANRP